MILGAREQTLGPGWRFLAAAGTAELVALTALGWRGSAVPTPAMLWFFAAFGAYAAAALAWRASAGTGDVRIIVGFAVAFRAALLPLDPFLSDDVFRYLWDGHVQLQGINPYLYAPADPALEGIRDRWHALVNHPEVHTIYPPVAQVAFLVIAALGGTPLVAKLLWITLDLAAGALLWRVAASTGRNAERALLLYLWSPLLVVETAWSGHLEPLGLVALVGILAAGARPVRAGALVAIAALVKLAPAAVLPPLARRLGTRSLVAFAVVCALLYVPYLGAGSLLWSGLATYAEHWRFNEGAFTLLERFIDGPRAPRVAAGAIVVGVVAWATLRRWDPERALFWILGTGILLSPTVHPWYVLWCLPFAALRGSRPWLLLSGLAFLGYWGLGAYQATGAWPEPMAVRLLIWLPFYALLVHDAVRPVRSDAPPP